MHNHNQATITRFTIDRLTFISLSNWKICANDLEF